MRLANEAPMRLELTREGVLVLLANHYTIQVAQLDVTVILGKTKLSLKNKLGILAQLIVFLIFFFISLLPYLAKLSKSHMTPHSTRTYVLDHNALKHNVLSWSTMKNIVDWCLDLYLWTPIIAVNILDDRHVFSKIPPKCYINDRKLFIIYKA